MCSIQQEGIFSAAPKIDTLPIKQPQIEKPEFIPHMLSDHSAIKQTNKNHRNYADVWKQNNILSHNEFQKKTRKKKFLELNNAPLPVHFTTYRSQWKHTWQGSW